MTCHKVLYVQQRTEKLGSGRKEQCVWACTEQATLKIIIINGALQQVERYA